MCWSYEVSLAVTLLELIALAFLLWRTFWSEARSNPIVRTQRFWLPVMVSVMLIELVETLLWAEGEGLASIKEAAVSTCSARNAMLTRVIGSLIYFQPLAFVSACRHGGDASNQMLLDVPQKLALVMGLACMCALFFGERHALSLQQLEQNRWSGVFGQRTCTYIGLHGRGVPRPGPHDPSPAPPVVPHHSRQEVPLPLG
jgi:hypothetical protein